MTIEKRRPLSYQRSKWELQDSKLEVDGHAALVYRRRVHDGILTAMVSNDPPGWHLSISHLPNGKNQARRYPTWDEIADARYSLAPSQIHMAMLLPPPDDYVSAHDVTMHVWQVFIEDGKAMRRGD